MPIKSAVDWASLEHAYGPAEDVPGWLEKVATARGRIWHEAFDELCSRVLHQGTIYSASPAAVEAIVEMLKSPHPPIEERRAHLVELLAEFAASARKAIEDGRAIPCCAGGDPEHGNAIRLILSNEGASFEGLLGDANRHIRSAATRVLAGFPDTDAAVRVKLEKLYTNERDENVRGDILTSLFRTFASPDFVEQALRTETALPNLFWLHLAKVRVQGLTVDDATIDMLASAFVEINSENGASHVSNDGEFFDALANLGSARQRDTLLRLLMNKASSSGVVRVTAERLLRSAFDDQRTEWGGTSYQLLSPDGTHPPTMGMGGMVLRGIGMLLLARLFPFVIRWKVRRTMANQKIRKGIAKVEYWGLQGSAPDMPERLSDEQVRVLQALADAPAVWAFRTNLWNLFGLPESPNAIRAYIIARTS